MKVLGFGEVLWDVFGDEFHIGGAVLNLVAHMARCGGEVELITSVGTDELGDRALAEMARLGVGRRWVQRDQTHPTGTVDVSVAPDGQPTFHIHTDVAYDHIMLDDQQWAVICDDAFDVVCFGTLAQRHDVSRRALRRLLARLAGGQTRVFCDINLRPNCYTRDTVVHSLRAADIVKLNDQEVTVTGQMLFEDVLDDRTFSQRACEAFGIETVIVTRGAGGCAVWHDETFVETPGRAIEVVNTVGSGDAFSAMFLRTYLSTGDVELSSRRANELGALVATQAMAVPEYPQTVRDVLGID